MSRTKNQYTTLVSIRIDNKTLEKIDILASIYGQNNRSYIINAIIEAVVRKRTAGEVLNILREIR